MAQGPRICPACDARFPETERFCLKCATVLVEAEDIERIGTTIGNYLLGRILGRGGMGTVYQGEHIYIGKKVAVKILHPRFARYEDAVKRFLREARAASAINHPNIVDVTDFGPMPDGGVYFVMEYLEGTSLEDLIEKAGAIPLHRALNVVNQMALALAAAHDKGIVHRDLKPDNIMLIRKPGRRALVKSIGTPGSSDPSDYVVEKEDEYDFVKIFDFGIAKVMTPEDMPPRQTAKGAVFGTPEYMSPEAARGEEVDHRSDIYALGIILYDMVTGRPPFEAEAASDVLHMQIHSPPPSPRTTAPGLEITPATEALIYRAMAKDPAERHATMDDLRAELQACYGSIAFKRNAGIQPPANRPPRKSTLTDEISDWIQTDRSLSTEEARSFATNPATPASFGESTLSVEDEARIARSLEDDD